MKQRKKESSQIYPKNPRYRLKSKVFALCFAIVLAVLSALAGAESHQVLANGQEYLSIDTMGIYKGMEQSYAKGYQPTVKNGKLRLIIPFLGEEKLKNNKINVRLLFSTENGPFLFRNYQRQVTANKKNIFLYDCNIKLDGQRRNGKYPITVLATGKTSQGKYFEYKQDIYVEITDGQSSVQNKNEESKNQDGEESGKEQNKEDGPLHPNGGENSGEAGADGQEEKNPVINDGGEAGQLPPEDGQGENNTTLVSHQPRVIMTDNNLSGQELKAGEGYDFLVGFKNCSTSQAMKNIKITLLTEAVGINFEKTNWYYNEITPGQRIELSQQLLVQKKAVHGDAVLEYMIEYEDAKGVAFTASEKTKLFVRQTARASLKTSTFPQKVPSTETTSVQMQVQNDGLAPIYNVRVSVEGAGLFPTKELFWGTVESGATVEEELSVYVGMKNLDADGNATNEEPYGNTEGVIKFTYEDDNGTVLEEVTPIKTTITKPKREKDKNEEQQPKSTQWVYAVYCGSLILLLVLVVAVFMRLRHYRKLLSMN